ncbi:hypothetical protein BDV93DRAFT_516980, partial [Ceratobasidium sp. AG-I]
MSNNTLDVQYAQQWIMSHLPFAAVWKVSLWMDSTYEFQGGLLPIPWQEIEDNCWAGKLEQVECSRMPNIIDVLWSPDYMDEQESNAWCKHIHKDWCNLDFTSHMFQFRLLGPNTIDTDLPLNTHPDSKLRYGPEARLYIAHLLRNLPVDANQTWLLGGLWLSPSYFNVSDFTVARSWSFTTLFDLVNDGGYVDPNTGTLLGGPLGTQAQLAQDAFPEGVTRNSGPYEISVMEHTALKALYDWLEKNVNHSMQLLQAEHDEQAGAPGMLEPVTFNRASSPVPFTMLHRMHQINLQTLFRSLQKAEIEPRWLSQCLQRE